MFIDTHCHLADNFTAGDIDSIIERATNANVGTLICPTADVADISPVMQIINKYENIFATIGIHPEYAAPEIDAEKLLTADILSHNKVVGVGEIGLDYYYGSENRDAQIKLFEQQLDIAKRANLPVAIHSRKAENDTIAILTNEYRGVMHCFTSSWNLAKTMLDRGFYFSASGILTFKNADRVRETFEKLPIDRIVIETDSPYCAPVPHRGKVCEPAMVVETAKVLAQIKNLQLDELESILQKNTTELYPKCHVK